LSTATTRPINPLLAEDRGRTVLREVERIN
jgi:hypothetical protein